MQRPRGLKFVTKFVCFLLHTEWWSGGRLVLQPPPLWAHKQPLPQKEVQGTMKAGQTTLMRVPQAMLKWP